MTKTERVVAHMKKYGSITGKEAWENYGLYRLSDAIADLRRKGCMISTEMCTYKDRGGSTGQFARYHWDGPKEDADAEKAS